MLPIFIEKYTQTSYKDERRERDELRWREKRETKIQNVGGKMRKIESWRCELEGKGRFYVRF